MPSGARASITAWASAGGAPTVPASPTPLAPNGLKGVSVSVTPFASSDPCVEKGVHVGYNAAAAEASGAAVKAFLVTRFGLK
jgi:hypothetical protein